MISTVQLVNGLKFTTKNLNFITVVLAERFQKSVG